MTPSTFAAPVLSEALCAEHADLLIRAHAAMTQLGATVPHFPTNLTDDERLVVTLLLVLDAHYETVRALTGWSKGRQYRLLFRIGARKTERRIQERTADRKRRQLEMIQELIGTTTTADVLDYAADLPDESVDLHLFSPPFNAQKRYCDAPNADAMPFVYYLGWMTMVLAEVARTLKPGGTVFLDCGRTMRDDGTRVPLSRLFGPILEQAGLTYQSEIAVIESFGYQPSKRLAERWRSALVYTKGEPAVYNTNAARSPQLQPGKRSYKGPNKGRLSGHPYGAAPTDVWNDVGQVKHNHPDARWGKHPAPFTLKYATRAILLYSQAGATVCDLFSGSGTVEHAALKTGRAFLGCDLGYADLRAARMADATPDLWSPLPGITDESSALWRAELEVERAAELARVLTDDALAKDILAEQREADAAAAHAATSLPIWQASAVGRSHAATPLSPDAESQLRLLFC